MRNCVTYFRKGRVRDISLGNCHSLLLHDDNAELPRDRDHLDLPVEEPVITAHLFCSPGLPAWLARLTFCYGKPGENTQFGVTAF